MRTWNEIEKSIYRDEVMLNKSLYGEFITEEEIIQKAQARGGRYVQRIETGKKDRPWNYIYPEDLLHPFKCLAEIFGFSKSKVSKSYTDNKINEEFGVDEETYGKHLLEFFRHKTRWEKTFSDKNLRNKYKKPVKQDKLTAGSGKDLTDDSIEGNSLFEEPKKVETKNMLNRSLMRKIWTIYSPNGKKIAEAEKTVENAKKDLENESKKVEQKTKEKTAKEIQDNIEFAEKQKAYFLKAADKEKGKNEHLYTVSMNAVNEWEGKISNYKAELAAVNGETAKETPAEEHENRSQVMVDNQNADLEEIDLSNESNKILFENTKKALERHLTLEDRDITEQVKKWSYLYSSDYVQNKIKRQAMLEVMVNFRDKIMTDIQKKLGFAQDELKLAKKEKNTIRINIAKEGISNIENARDMFEQKSKSLSEAMMGNQNAKKDGPETVEETPINETPAENQPQTESEMKEEQKTTEKAREDAGLKKPGKNYGERVSAMEDAVSLNPNAENYAYKDTGYIAGSQREKVQNTLKRKAEMGETVNVEDVDWNALEENSRTAAQLITKDNVIGKVDYQKMKDSGMDSMAAAMITSIYRSIGKEPVDNTPEGRKNFVWAISTLRERLESCKTYKEVFAMIKEIGEEKSGRYTTLLSMDSEYGDLETQYNNIIAAQKDINRKIINKYYDTKQRFKNEEERTKYWKDFIKKEYSGLEGYKISYGHYRSPYSNMPYISIDEAKKDELLDKKKAARKGAIERIEIANPMVKAWKQLGDKCLDSYGQPAKSIYDYYNAFSNLEMWKGSTTFTSQKDRNYAKYLNWGWEEKDKAKKEQSNIVKGRVKQKFEMVVPDKYDRIGGRNVSVASSEELKKAFNFRDIQVGTWVQTDVASARWHTNNINEGFADLCDITGIPDNLVSMNGRIAIAIGARGVKGAKAHYEPGERVIQINKMKGGGSLGHEWFHAFDNLISEAMNGGDYNEWLTWQGKDQIKMASSHGNNKSSFKQVVANNKDSLNQKVREKFTNLVKAMMDGDTPEANTVEFDAEKWDKCQDFHNLKTKVSKYMPRSLNAAHTFEEAKTIIDGYYDDKIRREKDYQSRGYTSGMSVEKLTEEKIKSLEFAAIKFADKEKGETEYLTGRIVSRYYQDAKKLGNGYWDTPHEMAARAFQCWLNDKLKEQGRKNTYLVGMVDNDVYKGAFYPYPTERDRVKINKAFDELFEVIRSENAIRKAIDILDSGILFQKSTGRMMFRKSMF